MEFFENIMSGLGDTPLAALRRFHPEGAWLAAKLEWFNPGSSVKDRIAPALIEAGEKSGKLAPGEAIVEPSSGAAAAGARRVARELPGSAVVVTLFPDSGERYLSKMNKQSLGQHGLLADTEG
jgi:cysteine synthase A